MVEVTGRRDRLTPDGLAREPKAGTSVDPDTGTGAGLPDVDAEIDVGLLNL